jgi:hypothetical protein
MERPIDPPFQRGEIGRFYWSGSRCCHRRSWYDCGGRTVDGIISVIKAITLSN